MLDPQMRQKLADLIRGSKNKMSKLTEEYVKVIKWRIKNNWTDTNIARSLRCLHIDRSTINKIRHNHIWQHVQLEPLSHIEACEKWRYFPHQPEYKADNS